MKVNGNKIDTFKIADIRDGDVIQVGKLTYKDQNQGVNCLVHNRESLLEMSGLMLRKQFESKYTIWQMARIYGDGQDR